MAYDYLTYCNALRTELVVPLNKSDTAFELILPRIIEAAELRCYRELDFLATRSAVSTAVTAASSRDVTLPTSIIVLESVNLISPAGTTNPESGTRLPLERVSLDFLNFTWPVAATTGTPTKYALLSDTLMRLAPTPAGIFTCECIGTARPTALSASNTSTFLTANVPDLFLAASNKYGADYLQDTELSAIWEAAYRAAFASVNLEALRQKAASVSWSPYTPTPTANAPRERASA